MANVKIECPKCTWEPTPDSRWQCSCGHIWNTFDTAGRCPSCGKQWKDTCCLSCHEWSPHIDWYKGLDDWLKEELEKIRQSVFQDT